MIEEKLSLGEPTGEDVEFEYESPDEVYLKVNDGHMAVLCRDDVIELIGFLSQFVDEGFERKTIVATKNVYTPKK